MYVQRPVSNMCLKSCLLYVTCEGVLHHAFIVSIYVLHFNSCHLTSEYCLTMSFFKIKEF